MSIFTKIKSLFSNSTLARTILRGAITEGSSVAASAVTTVLVTHGVTVPQDVVHEIISAVIGKIEDAI